MKEKLGSIASSVSSSSSSSAKGKDEDIIASGNGEPDGSVSSSKSEFWYCKLRKPSSAELILCWSSTL